ncbi:nucleoporin Nup37 [Lepeophtheirus salmonis]|uniref:nucleoporin Nup37 n=1 Tax=Lepeophtheirus salmonis TaxID=72036 RepID=UPI001AE231A8|nr:nucleoporin Nup37-like [Lepeophtheirus salmonis]
MVMKKVKPLEFPIKERAYVTEFAPFKGCYNLLAIGTESRVLLYDIQLPDEDGGGFDRLIDYTLITEIYHDSRVQALAFSPLTCLLSAPKTLKFATSDMEHNVRLFYTDLNAKNEVQTLKGHRSYVNTLVYNPETGDQIASGSDDLTVMLWDTETGSRIHSITFKSPVMSLGWHPMEVSKLMAAEKAGVIHIFNIVTYHPILSVDCGVGPLLSANWSLSNSLLISVALRTDWIIYDLSKPSIPMVKKKVHEDGIRIVKFSSCTDSIIATSGQPNYTVKITSTNENDISPLLEVSNRPVGGVSWNHRFNYLAVGLDGYVCIRGVNN